MNLAEEEFNRLWPEKRGSYELRTRYSDHFSEYNSNIRKSLNTITVSMSRRWKNVDAEIQIGLIQTLLLRILKKKANTMNIQLYDQFVKNIHLAVPKLHTDQVLNESFDRINTEYFYNILDTPNLVWGPESKSKLGSYNYHNDTITISSIFKNADNAIDLLDYVMYHEMLHKKHKFSSKNGRHFYHTHSFKQKEKEFKDSGKIEQKLKTFLRQRKGLLGFRWF